MQRLVGLNTENAEINEGLVFFHRSILVICQELFEKDFDMFFGKKGNFNRHSVNSF